MQEWNGHIIHIIRIEMKSLHLTARKKSFFWESGRGFYTNQSPTNPNSILCCSKYSLWFLCKNYTQTTNRVMSFDCLFYSLDNTNFERSITLVNLMFVKATPICLGSRTLRPWKLTKCSESFRANIIFRKSASWPMAMTGKFSRLAPTKMCKKLADV